MSLTEILLILNLPFLLFVLITKKSRFILLLNIILYVSAAYTFTVSVHFPLFSLTLLILFNLLIEYYRIFLDKHFSRIKYIIFQAIPIIPGILSLFWGAFDIVSRIIILILFTVLFISNVNLFSMKRNRLLTVILFSGIVVFIMPFRALYRFFFIIWLVQLITFNFMIVYNYLHILNDMIAFKNKEKDLLLRYIEEFVLNIFETKGFKYIAEFVDQIIFKLTAVEGYMIYTYEDGDFLPQYMGRIFPPLFPVSQNVLKKVGNIKDIVMRHKIPETDFYFSKVLKDGTASLTLYKNIEKLSFFSYLLNSSIGIENLGVFALNTGGNFLGALFVRSSKIFGGKDVALLETIAKQIATFIYAVKMKEKLLKEQRMEKELEMSHSIQAGLIPSVFPNLSTCEFYGKIKPAREMSGDYFDVLNISDGVYDMLVADVSGKGVPAALLMVIMRTLIKTYANLSLTPRDLLLKINKILVKDIREDMFITIIYARYYTKDNRFIYCSAGHNNPILFDDASKTVKNLEIDGIAVGIVADIDEMLKEYELKLSKGQGIFLYTDGVTEAKSKTNEFYEEKRLVRKLLEIDNSDAKGIVEGIYSELEEFMKDREQYDDITMLCMTIKK